MSDKIVAPQRLQKHPDEVIYYLWDFTQLLSDGETLTGTPSVACDTEGLTLGDPVIAGTTVKSLISGGTDGTTYKTTAECQTSEGQTWAVSGILEVLT